ncbi:MAG: class I tRNA ligase family protein [Candidatus Dormibacteria bacterium]
MPIAVRLPDSQSGALVDLGAPRPLTMYVCGVTPYDTTHLGHAFTYVVFDALVRFLEHSGYPVTYTRNVTDVDDPLFARARELGIRASQLAEREMARFHDDMRALRTRPCDHEPWASREVPGMIELVSSLLGAGQAYVVHDRVYFDTTTYPAYGSVSGRTHASMVRKLRDEGFLPDPFRRNPLDFLLWRPSMPDEPAWDAHFGRGRPGWHLECSAMARRTLGDTLDIHGGGRDLAFSHHDSEAAQSESVTGEAPFARVWMHTGMVRYRGHKMSKSLGNLVLVADLLARHPAEAIRWHLLARPWRRDWTFTEAEMEPALRATDLLERASRVAGGDPGPETDDAVSLALADGFVTARALRHLGTLARRALGGGAGSEAAGRSALRWGRVLGLLPESSSN